MAEAPGAIGRRYLPFLAVAAVQLLLVVIAPSKGQTVAAPAGDVTASGSVAAGAGTSSSPSQGQAAGTGANPSSAGATANGGSSGSGGTGSATSSQGSSGASSSGGGSTGLIPASGDRSDCTATGKQIGPPGYTGMPPCVPVWHGGDNGGNTMTGVTSTSINFILYRSQSNAQVNAILATQGLAASQEQNCETYDAFTKVANKYYSLYGRKLVPLDGPGANQGSSAQKQCRYPYFQSQCSLTPPDPACATAEAKVVAAMHPAFVLAPVADTAFYTTLTNLRVIVVGGGAEPEAYYDGAAPYWYGILMDGTRQAHFDADFWCRSLNNQPAIFAGNDVKAGRHWAANGATPTRKLAILFPETNGDESNKLNVDLMKSLVTGGECNSPGGVIEFPYASDITTATQQSGTIVQGLINNHVTTVACWCDPIAPVFLTTAMSTQGYYPEQFLLGVGLLDYDVLARLYNGGEWAHAFGVSDLARSQPFAQSDAVRWWQAAGNSGEPDTTTNATIPFFSLLATAFQMAGPQPTAGRIHSALVALPLVGGWAATHDPTAIQIGFRPPSPYTAAEDVRLAYWNSSRTSEVDGKQGAYCPIGGGHRYDVGQIPTGPPDAFDPAHNGC